MNVKSDISKLENNFRLQEGSEERFNGYGVMGLTFKSGHVLAYRNFMATSIGPAYRSVWHRRPDGEWTFYTDVNPSLSCPRYFAEQSKQGITATIDVKWTGVDRFIVEIKSISVSCIAELEDLFCTEADKITLLTKLSAGVFGISLFDFAV